MGANPPFPEGQALETWLQNVGAGVPQYCGRVVFSDLHVSGSNGLGGIDYANGNTTVPAGCASTATLQPDEDPLEFILFDLSSCITPVGYPPKPPQPPPEAGTAQ